MTEYEETAALFDNVLEAIKWDAMAEYDDCSDKMWPQRCNAPIFHLLDRMKEEVESE